MTERRGGWRVGLILFGLVVMHFNVRPYLGSERLSPDFLLLALMFFAIRSRPGQAAVAGFSVGIVADALSPVAFGASALAHTVIGYLQAWGKAVFFPDNLLVTAGFLFMGSWVRNLMVLLAGGQVRGLGLLSALFTWSLVQAATTMGAGLVVLIVFRRWLRMGTIE